MTWIAGADGCKNGWVVVMRSTGSGELRCRVAKNVGAILDWGIDILCIDVPIGLLDHAQPGGRECDRKARSLLGAQRGRSVFSAPVRATLGATRYPGALKRSRASSCHAIGISQQCFGILGKVQEVDRLITPELQRRVVEVHPEVTFATLNGTAITASKKSAAGRRHRIDVLEREWSCSLDLDAAWVRDAIRGWRVAGDDIVDAMAACVSAERVLWCDELRLPTVAPQDSRGLRMEIVA